MGFFTCALCSKEFGGHGHNPAPLGLDTEECCDACNVYVVDARVTGKVFEVVYADEIKVSNALKHVDVFLASYCKKIKTPRVFCRDLTYHGIKTSGTVEEANIWWDDMIGNFFSYLHTANKHGDPLRGRISYETATGYASSVRVYYMNKFRGCGPELNVFRPIKWRELRNKLLAQWT